MMMTVDTRGGEESPLACDMSAIEPAMRAQHVANGRQVFRGAEEIRELLDGYAFRLRPVSDSLLKAVEFIAMERLCCPFLRFSLEVEAKGGPVWLRLTGREGVRAFVRAEVVELLGGAIDWEGLN